MTVHTTLAHRRPTIALLGAAATFTATALFLLIAHPDLQGPLRGVQDYVLTATLIPAVAFTFWALSALQSMQRGAGRVGTAGLMVAAIGLAGLAVVGAVSLASATTTTTGPLYPISMLTTEAGLVVLAVAWHRAHVLPRWIGPTLALGWLLGATPLLDAWFGGAEMVVTAAAFVAVAAGIRAES